MNSNKGVDKLYLAIIPARGGSKRLPGKNVMKIGETSLIGRAIRSVAELENISKICVTTDDDIIAEEAASFGPYVHFSRPASLSTDEATTIDVVNHAVSWFMEKGQYFDAIILLQPTSPFRRSKHIVEAIELFESKEADAVVSVSMLEYPIEWCAELSTEGSMEQFGLKLSEPNRSQDFNTKYRLNGAIYIYDIEKLYEHNGFFYNENTYAYKMDYISSIDIDTREDFLLASNLSSIE